MAVDVPDGGKVDDQLGQSGLLALRMGPLLIHHAHILCEYDRDGLLVCLLIDDMVLRELVLLVKLHVLPLLCL